MFITYANLNEPLRTYLDSSNCPHVNLIKTVGIYPNVSSYIKISMKYLHLPKLE